MFRKGLDQVWEGYKILTTFKLAGSCLRANKAINSEGSSVNEAVNTHPATHTDFLWLHKWRKYAEILAKAGCWHKVTQQTKLLSTQLALLLYEWAYTVSYNVQREIKLKQNGNRFNNMRMDKQIMAE